MNRSPMLDRLIADAETQWRAWRERTPFTNSGTLEAHDIAHMKAITDPLVPSDRTRLLMLAADDRVWGESADYGNAVGECVSGAICVVLEHAMWSLDGVD